MLCIWREARGEILDAKRGVAWSIRNRVQRPGWWGASWDGVILKAKQYSSFNPGDPNATKIPYLNDPSLPDCFAAAEEVFNSAGSAVDPTLGATSYFDKSMDANPPPWAAMMMHTTTLGGLRFYK